MTTDDLEARKRRLQEEAEKQAFKELEAAKAIHPSNYRGWSTVQSSKDLCGND